MPKAMSLRTVSQRKRKVNKMFIAARMSDNKGGDSWYYNNLQNVAYDSTSDFAYLSEKVGRASL